MTAQEALSGAVTAQPTTTVSAPAEPVKRRPGRPLSPCGTYAAYARHMRNGQTPCEPCKKANALRSAEMDERKRALAAAEAAAFVEAKAGRVTIVASAADARMIAAALLDRAIALEGTRYTASSGTKVPEGVPGQIEGLRALHKRIAAATRTAA